MKIHVICVVKVCETEQTIFFFLRAAFLYYKFYKTLYGSKPCKVIH